ncbi:sugar transferase [Clostridium sp.]|uniref:sugar transferase n=1 Tax=Clostridium sp. TaxID=1506 RepID=UPI00290CF015|nr:sugar transferase [Clostridium sp.]MDU4738659.1 sugar transferase [Clostridium sp.]
MYKKYMKRFLDIMLAIIGLVILILFLIPISIMIYFEDKGAIFYNAPRLGENGKVFKMYKFRSMKVNSPDIRKSDGSTFNSVEDPRLTRIGRFIRKTSIDELPQLLNVIKGDMSIVGPRPDLPEHIELYIGNESRKLEVKPGITGLSQAYYRNTISWKERIQNDILYVDKVSFVLDLKIIFKTIFMVVKKEGIFIVNTKSESSEVS